MADPVIAQRTPFVVSETPGSKWWCSCGKSKTQPFCDGSHSGSPFSPVEVKIEAARKVAWCGCKHSKKGAFCDGSHSRLA